MPGITHGYHTASQNSRPISHSLRLKGRLSSPLFDLVLPHRANTAAR